MRIIPSTISLSVKSNAERKVFNLFKQMDWKEPCICFHSLRLSEHHYKKMGELDFVILSKNGLFVIEVKGGQVSRDDSGIWSVMDRFLRRHRKHESPFEQASTGLFSLLDSINEKFQGQNLGKMTIGYGVLFPDCTFDISSVEWAPEMIIDQRGIISSNLFKHSFQRLERYWRGKSSNSYQLSTEDFNSLVNFLRPKFDLAESIGHRVGEIEQLMVTMTKQQYEKLDAIENNQRIICTGGAGTGKTFIALEVSKRLSEQGKKTLFVCKSPILSIYLGSRVDPKVHVKSFMEIDTNHSYDAVVVDEGQDALNFEDLGLIERVLKGGFEKGTWRIFLDKNNQCGLDGRFEEAALEMLNLYNPVQVTLSRNCRNTEPIVNAVRLLTASDIGTATAGTGPEVKYLYFENEQDAVQKLEKEIARLLESEVALGDITLLSSNSFENSIASHVDLKLKKRMQELNPSNARAFPFHNISFSSVSNFKGLEGRFIFIIDLTLQYFQNTDMAAMYVAMTRARAGLTIIVPNTIKSVINKILINNISLLEVRN